MKKLMILWGLLSVLTPANAQQPIYLDQSYPVEQRIDDALRRMTLDEKIAVIHAQSKFSSPGVKRLGFPDLWTDDGPHGVRPDVLWDEWVQAGQTNDSCVAFPALTCLTATWNPDMARLFGESLAEEALYRKKSVMLGPGVNIFRTPLNGRNFEYMGEDPYLASRMVVPYVQGLQSKGVAACVKHYCLNNDEEYRHQVNVIVSDRALHEIYLPAFRAAVQEGGAWAIMGSYNLYNNQHNCHNEITLNKILKQDWGFDGVVISDWGGCHNTDEAVRNGLDLEFGTWTDGLTMGKTNAYDSYFLADAYKQAILEGRYTMKELDEKVRRVLRLFYRTTMNRNKPVGFLCSESHYEAALRIAQEGIVLLKNSPVPSTPKGGAPLLPLDLQKTRKILVVGENAIKMMTVGGGSSSLKAQKEILPLDGISRCITGKDYSFPSPLGEGSGVRLDYTRGYVGDTIQSCDGVTVGRSLYETRSQAELTAEAVEKAREADVVIFFGGLNKSGHQDCEGNDRLSYDLPYAQNEVIEAILKVNPRLVYVNISGNGAALPWLSKVPAVVQAWYIGSEAGEAIASVLTGEVNPSGKLPFTWYASLDQCGAHATGSYPGTWRSSSPSMGGGQGEAIIDEEYREGLFVGYRWTDRELANAKNNKQKKAKAEPLFPFGHGLSYTTFSIGKVTADKQELTANDQITLTVPVTNTGSMAGAETIQLYVSDLQSSVERPVKELKAFRKVFLQPGETQQVTLTIDKNALSFYNDQTGQWTAEPGDFKALIGTSSRNIAGDCKFKLR